MARHGNQILLAEDDPDDGVLIEQILSEVCPNLSIVVFPEGEPLLGFLSKSAPRLPSLIISDLNMPRVDGKQLLKSLKTHPAFQPIPVIILSTSNDEKEIRWCYSAGANSFITKPDLFPHWKKMLKNTCDYWLTTVQLP